MVAHSIDVEVNLLPNDNKLKKSLENLTKSFGMGGMFGGGKDGFLNKTGTKEDKKEKGLLDKLYKSSMTSVGILSGILGTLKKVPSILQASLKLMTLGFLLILKPAADLLGMFLMPIGLAMIKLGTWFMTLSPMVQKIIGFLSLIAMAIVGIFTKGKLLGGGGLSAAGTAAKGLGAKALPMLSKVGDKLSNFIKKIPGGSWLLNKLGNMFGKVGAPGILGKLGKMFAKISPVMWISLLADVQAAILRGIANKLGDEGLQGFFKDLYLGLADFTDIISKVTNILGLLWAGLKDFGSIFGIGEGGNLKEKGGEIVGSAKSGLGHVSDMGQGFRERFGIGKYAEGGIFNSPTVGMIGEAGPEAVIPLDQLGGMGGITMNINGIFEENRLRDIMRAVAEDVMNQSKQVTGAVF